MTYVLSVVVRVASWLAPSTDRARWREAWLAELQQIAELRGRRAAFRVAVGLLPDALTLRRLAAQRRTPIVTISPTDVRLALRMLIRYRVFMTIVGLLAAWGPARRGLRVEPTDALRED